ncbi:lysophosphatidylserine lipase ABHD12-like isoform X2 [Brachyistius frenatus]|uniref:lysophosphatidylserine lipase ABHD12-like isoform X2 n=1 Tax=Brachyistius frenatus TaxID=100188 RepID=UPI0037E9C070
MKRLLSFVILVYLSVPVIVYLLPWTLGHAIFSHMLRFPFSVDLSRPEDVLNHTCNFYLDTEEGVSVGVWAVNHRVQMVKILSAAGNHVLSLDYRGFGDSTGEPSEAGLTSDALYLYHWVLQHSGGGLVCLWGHSLGSGVATNTAVKIQEQGSAVEALILEAPYTRIREVVITHPLAKMYWFLPGFQSLLWSTMETINIVFTNEENLKSLSSPLLILHAEDDSVVPYHMGQKLYQISLQTKRRLNTQVQVEMISYKAELGFSHSSIYKDPGLSHTVQKFLQDLKH